jgi:hypothetical protein
MGSALCFPIETIIFAAVCRLVTRRYGLSEDYSVFGDDIIVPTPCAQEVMEVLQSLGFRVNNTKSFTQESCWFRESCGGEFCDGFDVTPMKVSRKYNHAQRDVHLTGLIDLANIAYEFGYRYLRHFFIRKLRNAGFTALFSPTALLSDNYTNYHTKKRWNKGLQRLEVRASGLTAITSKIQDEEIRYRHWLEATAKREALNMGFRSNVGRVTVLIRNHWYGKFYELSDQELIDFHTVRE